MFFTLPFTLIRPLSFIFILFAAFFSPSLPAASFPDFRLKNILDNTFISKQDLSGKVVLIDFWASWCGPCIESLPYYQKLYEENKAKDFHILAISLDTELDLAKNFILSNKLSFPAVFDESKRLKKVLSVDSIPTSFLLNREGDIVFRLKGFNDEKKEIMKNKIKELLK